MKVLSSDKLSINDIYVPIDDERLDFLLVESKRLVLENTNDKVHKERKLFDKGAELNLGHIILNPSKVGYLESSIVIIF